MTHFTYEGIVDALGQSGWEPAIINTIDVRWDSFRVNWTQAGYVIALSGSCGVGGPRLLGLLTISPLDMRQPPLLVHADPAPTLEMLLTQFRQRFLHELDRQEAETRRLRELAHQLLMPTPPTTTTKEVP